MLFASPAVSMLERQLAETGLRCGYSPGDKSLVAIGCAETRESPDASSPMFMSRRNSLALAAELDARKNLIKALKACLDMHDVSALEMKDGDVDRVGGSSMALSSQKELWGLAVLRMCETHADGVYEVAVAVQWSDRMSKAAMQAFGNASICEDRSASAGEWRCWASKLDWSGMAGNRKFIDSGGVARYAGIGCADVEGLEIASSLMRRAQDSALNQARANLSLGLYADTVAVETVSRLYGESGGEVDLLEACAGVIERRSDRRTALAPEVYSTFAVHPITKRKMFVSVCGYEPWQLAGLGIVDSQVKRQMQGEAPSPGRDALTPDVKIWNPNTGKFEERKE